MSTTPTTPSGPAPTTDLALVKAEIARLAGLDPDEYELTRRKSAADLGVKASYLDSAVERERRAATEAASATLRRKRMNGHAPRSEDDWRSRLILGPEGQLLKRVHNAMLILGHEDELAGRLALNTWGNVPIWTASAPWHDEGRTYPSPLDDADIVHATAWLERAGLALTRETVKACLSTLACERPVNAVVDYLRGVVHDGVPRLSRLLTYYFGAAVSDDPTQAEIDLQYLRSIGRMWLISAAKRALYPGSKVDTVLVLEGPQGARKSTALKVLFGHDRVLDTLADIGSRDAAQQLSVAWCIELAELDHLSRADRNTVKRWLSVSHDTYRPWFGTFQGRFPRPSIFVATHNPTALGWQGDETGGRRWWPVTVTEIDLAALEADRDQLWAEAVAAVEAGERHWLEADDAAAAPALVAQDERRETDLWEQPIVTWLAGRMIDTTIADIMEHALRIPVEKWDRRGETRVGSIMSRIGGWQRVRKMTNGKRGYVYERALPSPP